MSTPSPEQLAARIESARRRIQDLTAQAATGARRYADRRTLVVTVGVALVAVSVLSLSVLTSKAFRLDAQALTQIGRYHVEQNLPQSRETMHSYLKSAAPDITANLIAALIGSIPQLRPLVLSELDDRIRTLTGSLEDSLVKLTESSLDQVRADLEEQYPETSEKLRFEAAITAVAKQFNDNMRTMLHELYPQYASEMQRVESYLLDLRNKAPDQLTERERTEKEIIETLLRLLAREQRGEGPDA